MTIWWTGTCRKKFRDSDYGLCWLWAYTFYAFQVLITGTDSLCGVTTKPPLIRSYWMDNCQIYEWNWVDPSKGWRSLWQAAATLGERLPKSHVWSWVLYGAEIYTGHEKGGHKMGDVVGHLNLQSKRQRTTRRRRRSDAALRPVTLY